MIFYQMYFMRRAGKYLSSESYSVIGTMCLKYFLGIIEFKIFHVDFVPITKSCLQVSEENT